MGFKDGFKDVSKGILGPIAFLVFHGVQTLDWGEFLTRNIALVFIAVFLLLLVYAACPVCLFTA